MNRLFVTLLGLSTLFITGPRADTIEFQVPGLAGPSGDPPKTGSFTYYGPSITVNAVWVRYSLTVDDLGLVQCLTPPGIPNPVGSWWMDCAGTIWKKDAAGEGIYHDGGMIFQSGTFELLREYSGGWNGEAYVGFTQLADRDVVEMELDFSMNEDYLEPYAGPCVLLREASGEMYSVTVILDVELPVKPTTWGRLKSLY